MIVAMAGKYPIDTITKLRNLVTKDVELLEVDTIDKLEALTEADCIVLRGFKLNEDRISKINNLKFIQRWGAGFDTVDIEAAGKRNIYVSNLPGINAYAVSELVIMHILALYKNLILHHISLKNGIWTRDNYTDSTYTLKDKIVGLMGFGNIGKEVSYRVQGFGAKVQYYDIFRLDINKEEELNIKYVELNDLFITSDIVSIHLPLTDSTKNIINKDSLKLMKKSSILINTSRGGIVNEADLYEALAKNEILGAGLDCFSIEPLGFKSPFLNLNNIVLTPHIGGASIDLTDEMVLCVADNLNRLRNNEELMYIVNKHIL